MLYNVPHTISTYYQGLDHSMLKFRSPLFCLLLAFAATAQADIYSETEALFAAGKSDQAITQLEAAAKNNDTTAQALLGQAYETGNGVDKDLQKAFQLYTESAHSQDPFGQYYIGQAYASGLGTDTNLISAYLWSSLSSEQSSPVQEQAKQLQQQVAAQLTALQLEKAGLLVEQLKTLYLN